MFMHTFAPLMDPSLSIVHQEGAKRRRRPRPEAEQLERGMAKRERGREKRGRSGKYGFWVPKGTSARPSPSVPPSPPAGYRGRLNIVMETTILCISGKVRRWSKEEEEDKCCIVEMWVKYICYELAPLHLSLFTPLHSSVALRKSLRQVSPFTVLEICAVGTTHHGLSRSLGPRCRCRFKMRRILSNQQRLKCPSSRRR